MEKQLEYDVMADVGVGEASATSLSQSEAPFNEKISASDFDTIRLIGRGAFGEVRIVRKRACGKVYAMKIMKKKEMIKRNQTTHIKAERDVLALADSKWVVPLHWSFQSKTSLFLVMGFMQGGDLMTQLIKRHTLSEYSARFYIAETAMAIASVHKMNYVHRDLKPDNILIDTSGHIRLVDFGLCRSFESRSQMPDLSTNHELVREPSLVPSDHHRSRRSRSMMFSTVGTPDYIAPEVFSGQGYGSECDWWSLGVILFECLCGFTPFYAESTIDTCQKIVNWRRHWSFPRDAIISPNARDLIEKLICDWHSRLTFEEIKIHPFFKDIDWNNLLSMTPPWKPFVENDIDTRHFDSFEEESSSYENGDSRESTVSTNPGSSGAGCTSGSISSAFVGYTFRRCQDQRPSLHQLFQCDPE